MPLVSVITPTWQRHELLFSRAIPAVQAQTYPTVEHLVVSDGPDPELASLLDNAPGTRFFQTSEHVEPHYMGARARNQAARHARGDYIAYLDDDNAWRPDHLKLLVGVLEANQGVDFAYSQMVVHDHPNYPPGDHLVGAAPPQLGSIDTSLIVHRRRGFTRYGYWPLVKSYEIDWAFVSSWLAQGARWAFVPAVTLDYF